MLADLPLPAVLAGGLVLRRAEPDDLSRLLDLLADDAVAATRDERADAAGAAAALDAVIDDPANEVVVATQHDEIVGMLQLTRIPGLSRGRAARLLVEAVRVDSARRSGGVGTALMRWVIDVAAPATGASLVQLTSDRRRAAAHRFYERLGFEPSHVGFKLRLPG